VEAELKVHHLPMLLLKVKDWRIILVQAEGRQVPQHRQGDQIIPPEAQDLPDHLILFRRKKIVHQRGVNPNHHPPENQQQMINQPEENNNNIVLFKTSFSI
jgi:hypothetical protein